MKIIRRKTRAVKIGNVYIGGNHPIAIQSMVKTKTSDVTNTLKQVETLLRAGCEIIRLAVKDEADARAIKAIKRKATLPIIADIHFDWRLALQAIESGADKIRLNPGNIFKKNQIREIVSAAKLSGIPIRVGVNSGSVKGHPLKGTSFGRQVTGSAGQRSFVNIMVKSALDYIRILEGFKFHDIVISLKASNVLDTVGAYRKISNCSCDYPLHLGVTATGLPFQGAIKSGIAIGALLLEGIGDTIRISLTDKPIEEVKAARAILEALELRSFGPQIVSCPTCGRCEVDLVKAVKELESKLSTIDYRTSPRPSKLALMGCVVNGPGEAREADLGVAFGKKEGLLFKKGKPTRKIPFDKCVDNLLSELGD